MTKSPNSGCELLTITRVELLTIKKVVQITTDGVSYKIRNEVRIYNERI
ncbi:hypothetical protein ALT1000_90119 [Alteromonas macleodii]|jgi:hypothetical protein